MSRREKTRIVFYMETLSGGGAERALMTFLKHLPRSRYEIALRAVSAHGPLACEIPSNVDFKALLPSFEELSGWRLALYKLRYKLVYSLPSGVLHRLLRPSSPQAPDVEIAFVEGLTTKIVAAGEGGGAKRVAWVHCDLKHFPWPVGQGVFRDASAQARAYAAFDEVVAVSDVALKAFEEVASRGGVRMYNPVDRAAVTAFGESVFRTSPDTPLRLVVVGRVTHVKGVDRLLDALALLAAEGLDFRLKVVGTGDALVACREKAVCLGLSDKVDFTGFLDAPQAVSRECDILVCPSRHEGFNLAIVEGMMLGLPVVSTASGGPDEILEGGKWGVLTENSVEGLAYGLRQMLTRADLRLRCRALSFRRSGDFNLERSLEAFDRLIGKLLNP